MQMDFFREMNTQAEFSVSTSYTLRSVAGAVACLIVSGVSERTPVSVRAAIPEIGEQVL